MTTLLPSRVLLVGDEQISICNLETEKIEHTFSLGTTADGKCGKISHSQEWIYIRYDHPNVQEQIVAVNTKTWKLLIIPYNMCKRMPSFYKNYFPSIPDVVSKTDSSLDVHPSIVRFVEESSCYTDTLLRLDGNDYIESDANIGIPPAGRKINLPDSLKRPAVNTFGPLIRLSDADGKYRLFLPAAENICIRGVCCITPPNFFVTLIDKTTGVAREEDVQCYPPCEVIRYGHGAIKLASDTLLFPAEKNIVLWNLAKFGTKDQDKRVIDCSPMTAIKQVVKLPCTDMDVALAVDFISELLPTWISVACVKIIVSYLA